jgi:Mg-chelatase subunit ChlD
MNPRQPSISSRVALRLRKLLPALPIVLAGGVLLWLYGRHAWAAPTIVAVFGEVKHELLRPRVLGLLLVAPLLLWALQRSLADLPWQQRIFAALCRLGFLTCLVLGLAGVVRETRSQRVCVVMLIDVSDSVSEEALQQARQVAQQTLDARGNDHEMRLVAFAKRPRLIELQKTDVGWKVPDTATLRALGRPPDDPSNATGNVAATSSLPPAELTASDLQAALQLAYGIFPDGMLRRVVLLSDGLQTQGDIAGEVTRARGQGVQLWTQPYRFAPPGEAAIRSLTVPSKIEVGAPFKVAAQVYASRPITARARLYQDEMLNGLSGVRTVSLQPGENELVFDSVVRFAGKVRYRMELDELSEDRFSMNNRYAVSAEVPGRPAVLYVDSHPEHATHLANALRAQQLDVEVRPPSGLPSSLAELEHYALIILSDVSADQVSLSAQAEIERYVRDLGGGVIFAGGETGFGLGGWQHAPLTRILPVRMDSERQKDVPSVAMVLVIDRSGSMTGLPLEMAKAACAATVTTLQSDDLIGVIAFDSLPNRYVKLQPARYRGRIQNDIAQIQAGGGTAIFPALDAAYQDISVVQARKKHVILLTDGRADSQGIRDLVQAMVAEAITVTTVGLGSSVDAELLRSIADAGAGRYHAVADANALPRIFTRETEMVSRATTVHEWFPVVQTGNADFLKGLPLETAPLLRGYVATRMKETPAQQILASDTGEPILARLRVGLGQTVAWTSDLKSNWAVDWLRWPGFGRFWGQLVREHMRQKHHRELAMNQQMIGNDLLVSIDAFTVDQQFDNGLTGKLVVTGESGAAKTHELRQSAPGRYEARMPLPDYGSFTLRAELNRPSEDGSSKPVAVSFGHVSHPYPQEYAAFEPNLELMAQLAAQGGGKQDAPAQELFHPGDQHVVKREPLWPKFLFVALGLFLLDLLMRRVRLFDRSFTARPTAARR